MSEQMFVVLNCDDEPQKYGYESGVGHAFLVPSGFQNDPLAWLCEEAEAPTACGRTADGVRLVKKYLGDRMCGRCCRVVTGDMIAAAVADRNADPAPGESLADMLLADPETVVITLDTALAESDAEPAGESDKADSLMDIPAGPEFDRAVKAIWADSKAKSETGEGAPKGAKNAGQRIPRQSAWKPVKELPEAVACEPCAPYEDRGDGTGTCRSCGVVGPVAETFIPAVKAPREWCTGGKAGTNGCTACGRDDLKTLPAGNLARHKAPARVIEEAVARVGMSAHYKHGRAPVNAVTLLEEEDRREPKPAPLSEAPATVDSGRKSADDVKDARTGMYRGRTSITRGRDMTGAVPRERAEGGKPVPTTNDHNKLGSQRLDVSARTDKRVRSTGEGAEVVSDLVGGIKAAWALTSEEYEARRDMPGWAAFKKGYWRRVKRARDAAKRAQGRKALSREAAKRREREATVAAGKRIAATASRGKR